MQIEHWAFLGVMVSLGLSAAIGGFWIMLGLIAIAIAVILVVFYIEERRYKNPVPFVGENVDEDFK